MTGRVEGSMKIDSPDKVVVRMELKMTLADWKLLKDQLNTSQFPSYFLRAEILGLIEKSETALGELITIES